MEYVEDSDVKRVLEKDGVGKIVLGTYENLPTVNIDEIKMNSEKIKIIKN